MIIVGRGRRKGDAFRVFHANDINICVMLTLLSEGNGNRNLVINCVSSGKLKFTV